MNNFIFKNRTSVIFGFLLLLGGHILLSQDISVLSSTSSGCEFIYKPETIKLDTVWVQNQPYHQVKISRTQQVGKTGSPMLPVRVVVLGVPADSDVNVQILEQSSRTISQVNLLPVPEIEKSNAMPVEKYIKGSDYNENHYFPVSGISEHSPIPVQWREQRVVRLAFFPAQYHPVNKELKVYDKIKIRVNFTGRFKNVNDSPWSPSHQESMLEKALLNYESAKSWRVTRSRGLSKVSSQQQAGNWYQIPVSQDREGIYKITGQYLSDNNVDLASINPATLKIYNNGGRQLPQELTAPRIDGWLETPIEVSGVEDGTFDKEDYLTFYGKGVRGWAYDSSIDDFSHYINVYTHQNIYFLIFNDQQDGKRMETAFQSTPNATVLTSFEDRFFIEEDLVHPYEGGDLWVGQTFMNQIPNHTYSLPFKDAVNGSPLQIKYRFLGITAAYGHRFTIQYGDQSNYYSSTSRQFHLVENNFIYDESASAQLQLNYNSSNEQSVSYADWIEVKYSRLLKAEKNKLKIYSPLQEGVYQYQLTGFTENPIVYDVSDLELVHRVHVDQSDADYVFSDYVGIDGPRQYLVITASQYSNPESITLNSISNLRNTANGADMIMISHRKFLEDAERLKSHRETFDGFSVFLADVQDVYDEFSGGLMDPTAIRDFMKYAYENWTTAPSYLLLIGDGDYDYRNLLPYGERDFIPPFEYNKGLGERSNRSTDDWFTYIDPNLEATESPMICSVGRLPVGTQEEAKIVIDKIIQYDSNPDRGDWRQLITLVGDDEYHSSSSPNETNHTRALERMSKLNIPVDFNFKKIYLTEYPEVPVVGGRRKPQAQADLIEEINKGTLMVDYVGHGNQVVWADERIFNVQTDLDQLNNGDRLPFVYAATCAWGWYDNPQEESFAEQIVLREGGGAIASIAASRFCIAPANEALNEEFLNALFAEKNPTMRLGDALRYGKFIAYSFENDEMYHLFGDPAMRLGAPRYRATITEMTPDSLKALSVVTVKGQVVQDGALWSDFNGRIGIKGFDSDKDIVYTGPAGGSLSYTLAGNALYRGEAQVEQGEFELSFIVPKDISYGGDKGKVSLYFWNESDDGMGFKNNLYVGGSVNLVDHDGPEISLGFSSLDNFMTGEMVGNDDDLIAVIEDEKSGINITGEIGHKIILTVDGLQEDVTDRFHYDEGSYLQGRLIYSMSDLELGQHELTLKAWDNANNSSTQTIIFNIVSDGQLHLKDVMNYPNPMDEASQTDFTFNINLDAEIEIRIFTVAGRKIRMIKGHWATPGFNQIHWDGLDDQGDALANGVYLYKITARSDLDGKMVSKSQLGRLMMMR